MEAVSVTLQELSAGLDASTLTEAFGPESLGILIVKDLPPKFHELRERVLRGISVLAHLPEEELAKLEKPESTWLTGWSRGKEILASSGLPDFNKGSFYVNCAFHKLSHLEGPEPEMAAAFEDFASYTSPNVWPSKLEGLSTFKEDTKELCNLIIDVAEKVAENCDRMLYTIDPAHQENKIASLVKKSTCSKARLLHYYPTETESDEWCGEHLDHSCITGLTSALYIDERLGKTLNVCPDPSAGLYIRDRKNKATKIEIPVDCLAFQTGSALEEISRGKFKAVPHYVRGAKSESVSRETLAVFCQPNLHEMVNGKENFAQFAQRIVASHH